MFDQKGFFKLAGFMLLSRFQLMNGYPCIHIRGHCTVKDPILFGQMSYIGFADSKGEMKIMTRSFLNDKRRRDS